MANFLSLLYQKGLQLKTVGDSQAQLPCAFTYRTSKNRIRGIDREFWIVLISQADVKPFVGVTDAGRKD